MSTTLRWETSSFTSSCLSESLAAPERSRRLKEPELSYCQHAKVCVPGTPQGSLRRSADKFSTWPWPKTALLLLFGRLPDSVRTSAWKRSLHPKAPLVSGFWLLAKMCWGSSSSLLMHNLCSDWFPFLGPLKHSVMPKGAEIFF